MTPAALDNTQLEHVIRMANQIADNLRLSDNEMDVADDVAAHFRRFWPRSMKAQIIEYARRDGCELNLIASLAVAKLATE